MDVLPAFTIFGALVWAFNLAASLAEGIAACGGAVILLTLLEVLSSIFFVVADAASTPIKENVTAIIRDSVIEHIFFKFISFSFRILELTIGTIISDYLRKIK